MKTGQLNSYVAIQQLTTGQDEIGQPTTAWTTLASVWADIRYLQGLETIKGGAETSIVKTSIRIRRRTDITASMRVVYGSTTFQIKSVLPDEQNRVHVDLVCEVVA